MLDSIQPPRTPRPYINEGRFWDPDPVYGNEWLINLYALYKRGVSLIGPDPKTLIGPINVSDVREASKRDLLKEWRPKLRDQSFFANSLYQAYAILTMCRILHCARNTSLASKRIAATWVGIPINPTKPRRLGTGCESKNWTVAGQNGVDGGENGVGSSGVR
jgi:hypothetical protein